MINNFSENLKRYRKYHGIKQEVLAKKLNVTRQTISAYENNIRTCDLDMLIKIADILEITVDELIR